MLTTKQKVNEDKEEQCLGKAKAKSSVGFSKMSAKTELAVIFWNCSVIALLACVLQAVSYYWLTSLYNFKWDITRSPQFTMCFDIGVGFTALGVTLMLLQECGLIFGTLCMLASMFFMLETISSMEKDPNTAEVDTSTCKMYPTGLGVLLFPTLVFIGKAFKCVGRVQKQEPATPTQEDVTESDMTTENKTDNIRTFIRKLVEHLATAIKGRPVRMPGAILAISTCFVLAFIMASRDSFPLASFFGVLQVVSYFWLVSLLNIDWKKEPVDNFARCLWCGVGCILLASFMLFVPSIGFSLFSLFYTSGTICTLGSFQLLTEMGKTIGCEHTITRLTEWVKRKVGALDPDASKWETCSDFYCSDIGGIAEGLCALLCPALALPFGIVHGVRALGLGGLGGQKNQTLQVSPPVESGEKQQGKKRNKELDEFQHMVMKVVRLVILGAVLWFWGFALFVWTTSCLLLGVFYSLHYKSANSGFIICFLVGAFCTVLGVYLLNQPESGLILFGVFYTVGTLFVLGSTLFVVELWQQQKMAFDRLRAGASSVMILFLVLTLFGALWWKSSFVALTCCFLHIISSIWYSLTYVQYSRPVFTFHELKKEE